MARACRQVEGVAEDIGARATHHRVHSAAMAEAVVLQYLNDTNRPWNITNVVVRAARGGWRGSDRR